MRIIVHDYAGHPFQIQLSRGLAARGHDVLHLYCGSTLTPRGTLVRRPSDPATYDIRGISLGGTIPKTNFVRRYRMESDYARQLIDACAEFEPEVILSANTPSIVQYRLARWCRAHGVRLVSWIQDIYGLAAYRILGKKLPVVGHAVGKYFISQDKWAARASDAIVVITEDFADVLAKWGVDRRRIHVIHNWAPLAELPVRPRDNEWARKQALGDGLRFVYTGTLAMKHNPALLLELARMLDGPPASGTAKSAQPLGQLIVVSEGGGVEWLAEQAVEAELGSLRCFCFQPFEMLADVLGSADVLVAILEADAGVYSVPSKVLSYFCAARPVLLAVPPENLAARIVVECGAGVVVEPTDVAGFCRAARELAESPDRRAACGQAARQYAESHFDIERICDRFEGILSG
jgi:putative colanic acid biosynthesis glycosyltransferase WcaI